VLQSAKHYAKSFLRYFELPHDKPLIKKVIVMLFYYIIEKKIITFSWIRTRITICNCWITIIASIIWSISSNISISSSISATIC